MAAQLGKLDGDLGENKYAGLQEIYKKFAANHVQHSKDCKSSLDNLKTSVKTLEESIKPILTTVDETKNDIYKLLYSQNPPQTFDLPHYTELWALATLKRIFRFFDQIHGVVFRDSLRIWRDVLVVHLAPKIESHEMGAFH